ncbi:hypothetical protein KC347_g233 [Hortaea werneckii]|nr:hypothetical protein KC347_g233 [Hortaea werneckii]
MDGGAKTVYLPWGRADPSVGRGLLTLAFERLNSMTNSTTNSNQERTLLYVVTSLSSIETLCTSYVSSTCNLVGR